MAWAFSISLIYEESELRWAHLSFESESASFLMFLSQQFLLFKVLIVSETGEFSQFLYTRETQAN